MKLKPPSKATFYALCRQDFRPFLRHAYMIAKNGDALVENWHLDAIAMELMDVANGKQNRLIVNLPPRALKTFIVSVAFPVWLLGRSPSSSALIVSHTQKLSGSILAEIRRLLGDSEMHAVFPTLKAATIKSTSDDIQTVSGGRFQSFSIRSNVTGHGASMVIIDDPVDASESFSQADLDRANTIIDSSILQRLNNPATDPVIMVMQRLAVDDPSAYLLSQGGWRHLCLPAIATKTEKIRIGKDKFHSRAPGDLLFPKRYPHEYLDARKKAMGDAAFSAQFQQAPIPNAGGVISLSEFARFDKPPKSYDLKFLSVDPATGSDSGSYTAMLLCRISDGRLYVTTAARERMDISQQYDRIVRAVQKYDLDLLVVENSSVSKGLLELIRTEFNRDPYRGRYPDFLQTITPTTSKVARMEAGLKWVREGRVLLPNSSAWLEVFEKELIQFPGGKYDDQVDALSQAIKLFNFYHTDPAWRIHRGLSAE